MRRQLIKSVAPMFAVVCAISLVSCAPEPVTTTSNGPNNAPSATKPDDSVTNNDRPGTETDTQAGSEQPPKLVAEPMDRSCEEIFSVKALYEFDPNVYLIPSTQALQSSVTRAQSSLGSVSCDLVHPGLGLTVQYVFTKLSKPSAEQQSEIITSESSGRFEVTSSLAGIYTAPTAQYVQNPYWVSVSSEAFQSPEDAAMWSNLAALGLK